MSYIFLSDDWFEKLAKTTEEAGDVEIPEAFADVVLNITVTDSDFGERLLSMKGGQLIKGHQQDAPTQLTMSTDLARSMFIDNDQAATMKGFVMRKIKVDGSMTTLMKMQKAKLSDDQLALAQKIVDFTAS